jgi:septal ring factor EnvC (AmiA/AmiB activator)
MPKREKGKTNMWNMFVHRNFNKFAAAPSAGRSENYSDVVKRLADAYHSHKNRLIRAFVLADQPTNIDDMDRIEDFLHQCNQKLQDSKAETVRVKQSCKDCQERLSITTEALQHAHHKSDQVNAKLARCEKGLKAKNKKTRRSVGGAAAPPAHPRANKAKKLR